MNATIIVVQLNPLFETWVSKKIGTNKGNQTMKYSYSDNGFDIYRTKDGTRVCVLSNSLEGREMFNKYRKKDANAFWRQKGFNQ